MRIFEAKTDKMMSANRFTFEDQRNNLSMSLNESNAQFHQRLSRQSKVKNQQQQASEINLINNHSNHFLQKSGGGTPSKNTLSNGYLKPSARFNV